MIRDSGPAEVTTAAATRKFRDLTYNFRVRGAAGEQMCHGPNAEADIITRILVARALARSGLPLLSSPRFPLPPPPSPTPPPSSRLLGRLSPALFPLKCPHAWFLRLFAAAVSVWTVCRDVRPTSLVACTSTIPQPAPPSPFPRVLRGHEAGQRRERKERGGACPCRLAGVPPSPIPETPFIVGFCFACVYTWV